MQKASEERNPPKPVNTDDFFDIVIHNVGVKEMTDTRPEGVDNVTDERGFVTKSPSGACP
jgi:hypothetical protein